MTNRRDWKVGLSIGTVSPAKLRAAKSAELDCVEINAIEEGMYWKDLPLWEESIGIKVQSFHLPFSRRKEGVLCSNPATLDPEEWEQTKNACVPFIENAGQAGVGIFVIHSSLERNPEEGPEREALIESSIEHLGYLSDICKRNGAILAVEDLPRTCLGNTDIELKRIVDSNEDLRVCFDVNHLLKGTHKDFIRLLADRIITTHISDYDFVDERHLFPRETRWTEKGGFMGKINWGELQKDLEEADYKGAWMYEVSLGNHPIEEVRLNRESLLDL